MVGKRGFTSASGWQAARCGILSLAALLLWGSCGCERRGSGASAIQREYAKGNYNEAIALGERAVRHPPVGGEVYYTFGMSLLATGRDSEAFKRLEEAVSADSALARDVSAGLVEWARDSIGRGMTVRAARLIREAVRADGELRIGPLGYLVADSYFEEKDWQSAGRYYARALAEYPDTIAAEQAYFNLAACQCAAGDSAAAIESLEKELSRFPRGALASQARWSLAEVLYGGARSEFDRGNYAMAADMLSRMPRSDGNVALDLEARFLRGECYERMGDFAEAYAVFKSIADGGGDGSARIAERARAKMKAFHDAGLH